MSSWELNKLTSGVIRIYTSLGFLSTALPVRPLALSPSAHSDFGDRLSLTLSSLFRRNHQFKLLRLT